MQEKVRMKVDEGELQQMIAADVPIYKAQKMPDRVEVESEAKSESEPKTETEFGPEITQDREISESEVENSKTQKKKRNPKPNFAELFLKEAKIKDRRQIYISKEAYDKIFRYLRYIGEGNVSLVSYVDNILFHHMDEYRDTINDLYNKNISTPL
jgi:hypothetical protein